MLLCPHGKERGPSFKQVESTSLKDALCQVWLKLTLCFWRRRFLNFVKSIYFYSFFIISHLKRASSFIWTNMNSLHTRMFCKKFRGNWQIDLEDKKKMWQRTKLTWACQSFNISNRVNLFTLKHKNIHILNCWCHLAFFSTLIGSRTMKCLLVEQHKGTEFWGEPGCQKTVIQRQGTACITLDS